MSKINAIQNAIKELEGGRFQKLFDTYLFKKYGFGNIQSLGVQDGTDKTTKGTPDAYVINDDGTFTFIMYGTVGDKAFEKLKNDILSCFDYGKSKIDENRISKIICAYSNTNINAGQMVELKSLIPGKEIELIGIDTVSQDLFNKYPFLAEEFLNIPIGTSQIYDVEDFVEIYDRNRINSPLSINFIARNQEQEELYSNISLNIATLVTGASGIGKTRLIIEVCRKFVLEGWKVICVKNNGSYLLDDIKYYINDTGKYLLFIDDANQTTSLEAVLSYVSGIPRNIEIKIVMSVRDYAKERLCKVVNKYLKFAEQKIESLSDDNIKEILKENLQILNEDYIDRIVEISKGNARLAVLAGKASKEFGYLAIGNVIDIFRLYYQRILDDTALDIELVKTLFIISLLGAIKIKENNFAEKILGDFCLTWEQFSEDCKRLNELELIDLHYDAIAQISDQSFGDFIKYYVLIEKKYISIERLLDIGFPVFKNKIVYTLNTLIKLFNSDETKKYIEQQVKNMWEKAPSDKQWDYLRSFHALNQEKSLSCLNQRIQAAEVVEFDLESYDFEKEQNNRNINNEEIDLLCNFKYTNYFEDVIDLLLLFYKKRPDMFVEFYYAFTDRLGYDEFSYKLQYEKELMLVRKIWEHSEEGKNKNVTFLLVKVLDCFLECRFHKSRFENNRTIKMYDFRVSLIDGSEKLRRYILNVLAQVYRKGLYIKLIHNILSKHHTDFTDKEEARKTFSFDYEHIKELFFPYWDDLTFEQCKVLKSMENNFNWLGLQPDEFVGKYNDNEEYVVYDVFQEVHDVNMDWKEKQEARKNKIESFVNDYTLDDYLNLFLQCKKFEDANDEEGYHIATGINIILNSLKNNISNLLNIVELYLEHNAPYGRNMGWLIQFLVENIGANSVIKLIEKYEFDYKYLWLCDYYSFIPVEDINDAVVKNFSGYVHSQLFQDIPAIPSIEYLMKYKKIDSSITDKASKIVLEKAATNPYVVTAYFGWGVEKNIEIILEFFGGNLNILEDLYIVAIREHYDYDGKLFLKIMELDDEFWNKFIKKIVDNRFKTMYYVNIFEKIWSREDYESKINIAFEQMIGDDFWLGKKDAAEIIFCNKENTPEDIRIRKKMWLQNYIALNFSDEQKMITIFRLIADVLPFYKKELILEVTKYRKDVDFFKKIPLFPTAYSWTGSQVPLIDVRIEFIDELIASLEGFEFIEHRSYLVEQKEYEEKYKNDVLVREHIENLDII